MDCSRALPAFAAAVVVFGACAPVRLLAQDLTFRREVPGRAVTTCADMRPAERTAVPQSPDEATRLAAAARESALLGDLSASRDLLARAAAADTTSASIAFLFARALDDLGELDAAVRAYCRYIALAPAAPDVAEVRQRIASMPPRDGGLPDSTVSHFITALAFADERRDREADLLFSRVIEAVPSWPVPYLDRGIVRSRNGRLDEARADFERFIDLAPSDPDAPAVRMLLARADVPVRTYSAGTAFALGIVPGGGHFYTGRPLAGTGLLVLAGSAVAFGALYEKQYIDCLTFPVGGACPPDQVRGQRSERPYLLAGIGVAAVTAVIGALDAARGARSRSAREANTFGDTGAVRVHVDRVDVALLRLRF